MRKVLAGAMLTAALLLGAVPAQPAQASPWGTVRIQPSTAACGGTDLVRYARCGAAFTERFLRNRGVGGVVRETVLVQQPSVGVWPSSTTDGICGFARVGPIGLGLHHCDRLTFIEPRRDAKILTSDVRAITALVHESGHGIQERAGFDPVAVTLSGDNRRLFPLEQSADCWSGVGIAWFVGQRMLPSAVVRESRSLFREIGDPGHGAGEQRVAAFDAGLHRGAAACDTILGARAFPR